MSTRTYISLKDTNALIRKALRASFPGVKFSVTGNSYAGGASTEVRWTDGPTTAAVEKVARAYQGATFDSMTDSMDYVTDVDEHGNRVHYAADWVFCTRKVSPEAAAEARALLERWTGRTLSDPLEFIEVPARFREARVREGSVGALVEHLAEHLAETATRGTETVA